MQILIDKINLFLYIKKTNGYSVLLKKNRSPHALNLLVYELQILLTKIIFFGKKIGYPCPIFQGNFENF